MNCQQVRIVESILDIDPEDWSLLQIAHPFVSYGWLATVETTALNPPSLRYVLLYANGVLSGAAVCEEVTAASRNRLDNIIMGRLSAPAGRLGISFEPALICCAFDGYGSTFLHASDASAHRRQDITRHLLAAVQDYAKEHQLPIAICSLIDEDRELSQLLESAHFHESRNLPVARLESRWTSFDGYLRSVKGISKGTAKDIRRERNRLSKTGTEIARLRPADFDLDRLLELLSYNYRKHDNPPFPFNKSFFHVLVSYMPHDVIVYGAWRKSNLVAFSLMLKTAKKAWGVYYGCDYEACARDGTYFNIVFNRPIQEAIEHGLAALYYGRGLHELKQRRGCAIVPSYIYYKAPSALRHHLLAPAFEMRSRYFTRKTALASDPQHAMPPKNQ